MSKLKSPHSPQAAITESVRLIGRAAVADAVGKSESRVYQLEDPDGDHYANLIHALKIDAACAAQAGRAPILEYYQEVIERILDGGNKRPIERLEKATVRIIASVGMFADMLEKYTSSQSDGGEKLTAQESVELIAEIKNAYLRLRSMELKLEKNIRPTAA